MTILEIVQREGITMDTEKATSNPNMPDAIPDAQHWLCVLRNEGKSRTLDVPYSMGPAHKTVTRAAIVALGGRVEGWKMGEKMPFHGFGSKQVCVAEAEAESLCEPTPPELADVLDCLASNAMGIENARCFEEWAAEYGYDEDSRRAERVYRTCQEEAAKLARFLGEGVFQEVLDAERL